MDTYFAPAEVVDNGELSAQIQILSHSPVVDSLLHSVSGLIAVLNEHRQLVALNDSFMQALGITDAESAFGLRPGEALDCIHAHEHPSGCGTTDYCSTCGAAVAIVVSICEEKPAERICALTVNHGDTTVDKALLVRSHPIIIDHKKFVLLFLQDITRQQQRAALERTFFHDINNLVSMLIGASEMLVNEEPSEWAKTVHHASLRITKEVAIQQSLSNSDSFNLQPVWHDYTSAEIIQEVKSFFAIHPVAFGKNVTFSEVYPAITVKTDLSLISRVLCNMIINALEATERNGHVRVGVTAENSRLNFNVWNAREIPLEIRKRIFQRNFSTKAQAGRGIGTFSMKLFGEKYLGGKVDFTTSSGDGTIFRITLPLDIDK